MEHHEQIHKTKRQIFLNNFIGGIAWGLGATVGVSIFFALVAFIISRINLIPIVGNFVVNVSGYILHNNPNLLSR